MPLPPGTTSEVVRLREQITREHQAASWALTGPAIGTAQHWFITRRMERIDGYRERLSTLIGEKASIAIVATILEDSPPPRKEP